ncbi:lytic transglycosylase domain-containing protein [Herbiconiux liangxiaofengii]|uniref:lytic transglycosylase domain-containing protein n=1 Tax=Herbiconiux liangxiaofengii TaxID=3342795 RepID=UPI0035BB3657
MTARAGLGLLVAGMLALAAWIGVGALSAPGAERPAAAVEPAPVLQALPLGGTVPDAQSPDAAGSPSGSDTAATAPPGGSDVTAAMPGTVAESPAGRPAAAPAVTLVDGAWADAVAARTGIPPRALVGYAAAALTLLVEQPSCGLGWNTLAALGDVESGHGTHGGSAIDDSGTTRPAIQGPSLDGTVYDGIPDTDGGAYDGDARWDRAVGPLQFIPETWATWGADGDLDGRADPQQIDDAALAAARYLCHYGALTDPGTWRTAVFAYNHVESYVDLVATTANSYAAWAVEGTAEGSAG